LANLVIWFLFLPRRSEPDTRWARFAVWLRFPV
jgi:hypothetical protein